MLLGSYYHPRRRCGSNTPAEERPDKIKGGRHAGRSSQPFSSTLKATKEEVGEPSVRPVTYSGQVLDADSDGDDEAWFAGKLKFRKHTDDLTAQGPSTTTRRTTAGKFGSTAVPRPRSYGGQAPPPDGGATGAATGVAAGTGDGKIGSANSLASVRH